jgi:hypothetical protein
MHLIKPGRLLRIQEKDAPITFGLLEEFLVQRQGSRVVLPACHESPPEDRYEAVEKAFVVDKVAMFIVYDGVEDSGRQVAFSNREALLTFLTKKFVLRAILFADVRPNYLPEIAPATLLHPLDHKPRHYVAHPELSKLAAKSAS